MTKPDYMIEAREIANTIPRQRTRATRLAMERSYNDGHLDGFFAGLERAAEIAQSVRAPASIGRDHGRHHEAGAQSAARLIRAEKEKTDGTA